MSETLQSLENILDFKDLSEVFKYFSISTELSVALYGADGREKFSFHPESLENICGLAGNCDKCIENMSYSGRKSADLGQPYIYACGCGLIKCTAPVIFDGELAGSIACGPVVLWDKDELAEEELIVNTVDMDVPDEDMLNAFKSVPEMSCKRITAAAQMLLLVANHMCSEQAKYLTQRSELNKQQKQISELLAERKLQTASLSLLEQSKKLKKYPLNIEKELVSFVQMGDRTNAKRILNELLGEIFAYFSGNLDNIRARLYELSAILSRAAIDAGVPIEALNQTVKKSAGLFSEYAQYEDICRLSTEILESFISCVYEYRSKKPASKHLATAIQHIKKNYTKPLTLEGVAKAVFVSGFYLSHLFRSEMDMTFSDYVSLVRIEAAKELLKDRYLTIQEASDGAGFNDANYFAKIFKKFTGVSPRQYQTFYK